jgi:hypothetical protein
MKRNLLILIILMMGMLHPAYSQSTWTGINQGKPVAAATDLISSDIQTTRIHFSLDGFFQTIVNTPAGEQMIIASYRGEQITEIGAPDLGKLFTNIIIPDIDQMQLKVARADFVEYENILVAPSKGHFSRQINPDDVPFEYSKIYTQDEFWPGKLAQLEDAFIMRDFRGQTVTVNPFQYNPVTKVLRVYTDIVLEVSSTGKQGENTLSRTRELNSLESEFRQVYNHYFLNMDYYNNKYILDEEGSMLIIVYDAFADAMKPFINWKRQTGRKTEMVLKSQVGTTAAAIQTYVASYYAQNPDFTYLLLVGDAPQIPTVSTTWGAADNGYAFLVGNDQYNEIFVGRFSAENVAHVETQVQRMIEYERDLNETDTWMKTGMGIAKNEGTGSGHYGENDYVHMDFIRDSLLNFTYDVVYRNYDGNVPGVPNITAAQMSAHFNQGVSITNFCNHGSETGWSVAGYNISHVNALTNIGRLPFIWSVACVNGAFVNTFCFAEAWMRATHDGQPTGAIGIMAATINQPWQPPMTGQDEMVTILVEKRDHIKRTFGGVSINGSMKMISAHGAQGISTHVTWILFGDPSLQLRTSTPAIINATYNPVILIGTSSLEVMADADGATAALSYFDDTLNKVVIVGAAKINQGIAVINFDVDINQPMDLTLTITGFNKKTYINDEIQVIPPSGPYVIFNSVVINDQVGNNNGQADYGEIINLDLSLKNVGIELAQAVQAVITTQNENVTILQNQATWGNIPQNGSMIVNNAFQVQIGQVIPDNHNVLFTINATDGNNNSWESKFTMKIFSPQFTIASFIVDDGEGGNGRLDPGETANLVVRYTNIGGAPAMSPQIEMSAQSPYFTIHNNTIEPGIIAHGEYIDAAFSVTAHPAVAEGTFLDLMFDVEDGHYFSSNQTIIIGQQPEITIGNGNATSVHYPFYNYYKANRSQMLYLASEMGAGEKVITHIGFNITRASAPPFNELPNFQIRFIEVANQTMPSSYIASTEAHIVLQANPYVMPTTTGWHMFELTEPYFYQGELNLVIETRFGLLPNWTSTWYQVASTDFPAGTNMTVFGYSDSVNPPNYNNAANRRPNLFLQFAGETPDDVQPVVFTVTDPLIQPLENAAVMVGSFTQFTDQQGLVSLELLPGSYSVGASKANFIPLTAQEFVVADVPANISIILQPQVSTVNFSITDASANPINDAVVTFNGVTNPAGNYVFSGMDPGSYSYNVSKSGYVAINGTAEVAGNTTVEVVMFPAGSFNVSFVVKDQDGNDLPAAVVTLGSTTNTPGNYLFPGIQGGMYSYSVHKPGYIQMDGQLTVVSNTSVEVVLALQTFTLTFTVKDQQNQSLTDAVITIGEITNPAGNYVFENFLPGQYNYFVQKEGYATFHGEITVSQNDIVDVVLEKTFILVFNIENELGEPVTDVIINLNGNQGDQEQTTFADLLAGEYIWIVQAAGYHNNEGQLTLEADAALDVVMIFVTYTVTFNIMNDESQPVNHAIVTLDGLENLPGDYIFTGVLPGTYDYAVKMQDYSDYTGSLTVNGENLLMDVVMTPTTVEIFTNLKALVYPNPTSGKITLKLVSATSRADVILSDHLGRVIGQWQVNPGESLMEISLQDYPAGIYFLRVHDIRENIIERIILQK